MGDHQNNGSNRVASLFSNWLGFLGALFAGGSLFAVLCLIAFDYLQGFSRPYLGILTYTILPGLLWIGLIMMGVGLWKGRRRRKKHGASPPPAVIDLNNPRHRRNLATTALAGFTFFVLTAFGSYQAYQVTESVAFCGALCHTVMEPEYTTYQRSPHARVPCTACHIGPGASWFVRSKISGLYQVYAVIADAYPRPIPVPVENLRPARGTCEQCHWPEKFYGGVDLFRQHSLPDPGNTPWAVRLLLNVGGANPTNGPVGGIHWHMIVANRIEYIPADRTRQEIPWIRVTNLETGGVTIYESRDSPLTPKGKASQPLRLLDCIDCHNRPSHIFSSPDAAVDVALWLDRIDSSIPSIRANAVEALVKNADADSQAQGSQRIAQELSKEYADYKDQEKIHHAISETQEIFRNNFFPTMKTSWKARPDNIGHHIWPGCFRCHDGSHVSPSGETIANGCDTCHVILAQGQGLKQEASGLKGQEFDHPGGELPPGLPCSDCHAGSS
jgi:hypothetical protein